MGLKVRHCKLVQIEASGTHIIMTVENQFNEGPSIFVQLCSCSIAVAVTII
jgi:hypothetical protein